MKHKNLLATIASVGLLGMVLTCQAVWAQGQGGSAPPHVAGRILVKFKDGVSDGQARGLLAGRNALSTNVIPGIGIHIVQLPPNANEQAEANAFKGLKDVEFAEVDQILTPQAIAPNDVYYSLQWNLPKIYAPDAWSTTTGSTITIAVVDTGVVATQPDLSGKLLPGWNVVTNTSDTSDQFGHGTEVAGVAAAATNNGTGIAGVCWGCMILPVKVVDSTGTTNLSQVASGVTWAADHGARIVNASFQITGSSTVATAAQYLWNKGGLLITAAGDYGFAYPTVLDNPYVLEIGSSDPNDVIYSWSNTGPYIDLVAPGCAVTTLEYGNYNTICGTSVSAPLVAGVAALMLSVNAGLTPAQLTSMLQQSADDLGAPGLDSTYGWGRLNALKAVTAAGGGTTKTNTTTTLTSSLNPSTSGQTVTFTATVSPSTATGTVTFKDGTTTMGTASVVAGIATYVTASLSSGPHSITAGYNGDASDNTSTSGNLAQTVNFPAPVISSSLTASGTVNTPFSYQITATNSPNSFAASGLPSGLSVNAAGLISGTPTVSGSSNVTISATNSGGTGTAILGLTISTAVPPAPVVTSATTASGTQNSAFGYQITATNSPTSFGASSLPSGLSVNTAGLISGTPTVSGSFNVTISATNSGGTGTANLALTISTAAPPAPVVTSAMTASGTQNSAFGYQIAATNSPTSYGASGLPSGLTVNTSTGMISGTPTVSGTFNVTVSARNSGGMGSAIPTFTITAAPPPAPVITSSLSASGTQNAAFSYQITASNSPSSFGASGLPSGLSVNTSSGLISGVPTGSGTFNITISATNSGGAGSAILSLTINQNTPPPPDFSISASPGSATIKSNGTARYTITVTGLNGFGNTVNFTEAGGGTASFSPSNVTGSGSTTMTVSAPRGNFTLTVTATSGTLVHTATVSLKAH